MDVKIKVYVIVFKNICMKKKTIQKLTNWVKTFANHVTDTGLVSKIYKQLMMLNNIKTNCPLKIWAEGLNRHFSKEDIQMASKHMKRCSTLLVTKEMQIKTTVMPGSSPG